VQILDAGAIPPDSPSLAVTIDRVSYRVTLPESIQLDLPTLAAAFLARDTFPLRREKKGRVVELDLRKELVDLNVCGSALDMTVRRGKPLEFAAAVTALPLPTLAAARIEKLRVFFVSE
jgi:hypothetical protein